MKNLRILSLLPLLFLFLGLAPDQPTLPARAKAALAQTSGTLRVPGLARPVTVLRDRWGFPTSTPKRRTTSSSPRGSWPPRTVSGRWRSGAGPGRGGSPRCSGRRRSSATASPACSAIAGTSTPSTQSYAPDAKGIIEAFVRGVNAFIAASRDRPPVEFELAGFRPEPWTPEVCLTRMAGFGMTGNASIWRCCAPSSAPSSAGGSPTR